MRVLLCLPPPLKALTVIEIEDLKKRNGTLLTFEPSKKTVESYIIKGGLILEGILTLISLPTKGAKSLSDQKKHIGNICGFELALVVASQGDLGLKPGVPKVHPNVRNCQFYLVK